MSDSSITTTLPYWEEGSLAVICGIANAGGGSIVVMETTRSGRGETRRFRKPFESIPSLSMAELGLACTTEPVMHGMDLCLEINVPAAEEPISYRGNYYLYSNGSNQPISSEEVERLYDKNADTVWESRLQPFVREEDLDEHTLTIMQQEVEKELGPDAASESSLSALLQHYGIKSKQTDAFTNTGVLLMHRAPEAYIPGAFVHIGLFGADGVQQGESELVTGPISTQLSTTLELLFGTYLPAALEEEAPTRREGQAGGRQLPPREAVREALLNALVHKDYESGVPIKVSVFPAELYIDNVGRPPASWTLEDLLGRHNSRPRNLQLMLALQRHRMLNGWGTGIGAMIEACEAAGMAAPRFSLRADEMDVCFPFGRTADEQAAAGQGSGGRDSTSPFGAASERSFGPASTGMTTGDAPPSVARPIENDPKSNKPTFKERSIAAANRLDMTGTDEYVLKVIETNGRVTALRIATVLGVSESTVRRSFRRLRELGLIERIGSDKAGYWRLTD